MYYIEKVDIEALDDYPVFTTENFISALEQCHINCNSYKFKAHEAHVTFEVYDDQFNKYFESKKFNNE